MRYFITGCAGFIGSHLVDCLLQKGHEVIGYDNLSTGHERFLEQAKQSPRFHLVIGDCLDVDMLTRNLPSDCDAVFHLAANADVRRGPQHPDKDFQQNTLTTLNVLTAMRHKKVKRIVFTSTGSVYGEATVYPTPEEAPFPVQTSLYGASKLAAEGFIQAYCEAFNLQAYLFRLVSILGERYTHGHVIDFYRQLRKDPQRLTILGDGTQRKSYLAVSDCVAAIYLALETAKDNINIFNLGTSAYCTVNDSVNWICEALHCSPKLIYSGGERGWIGDNPFIWLDTQKIRQLGWVPQFTIQQAVMKTLTWLQDNEAWMTELSVKVKVSAEESITAVV